MDKASQFSFLSFPTAVPMLPSTITFNSKALYSMKPTLQKVVGKDEIHLVLFFTKSQYEHQKSTIEREIISLKDSSTSITVLTLDKFPISTQDLDSLQFSSTKNQ